MNAYHEGWFGMSRQANMTLPVSDLERHSYEPFTDKFMRSNSYDCPS
jgi:hypothetical protein